MTNAKVTKRDMFIAIREAVATNEDFVRFLDHEIELLNAKSANRKPTKVQVENETFKALILAFLTEKGTAFTIKELQANIPELAELSNQKITHLLSALGEKGTGQIVKTYDKKTPHYEIA